MLHENEENPVEIQGENFEDLTKRGYGCLMEAIRNANSLPSGRDYSFYQTHDGFQKITAKESFRLEQLITVITKSCEIEGSVKSRTTEEKTEIVVEANDVILERAANGIDEMNGIKNKGVEIEIQAVSARLPANVSWNRMAQATFSVQDKGVLNTKSPDIAIRLLTAKNIIRPQKFFKDKINNSSEPFLPRIKDKPNNLKPLAIFLEETERGEEYSHPYEFELEHFEPSKENLQVEKLVLPKLLSETPLIEVCDEKGLLELVEDLRGYDSISIDVEHHSYRTFLGITCLLQISTKDKDYLIDALVLRDKLHVLNEIFTNKNVVKVFHGAEMDVQWLQRDLSLYVVNMFDTQKAAKKLQFSGLSLAFLIQKYCNFAPDKQFQLADWRMRPLPDALKNYAREDTHYLNFIYQNLKKELLAIGHGNDHVLKSVWTESTAVCKIVFLRYFKPIFTETSYKTFYEKCKKFFDNRQLFALKGLYKWRDEIARLEDESTGYVLPNHMMLQIASILPREMQGVLACCNPIPPLVRSNVLVLHQIVLKAREQSLEKPIFKVDSRDRGQTKKYDKVNIESPLFCPHDLSKSQEFRNDLPTLLGGTRHCVLNQQEALDIEWKQSKYEVFNHTPNQIVGLNVMEILTPYERYKRVKPFVQAEEEKRLQEEELNKNKEAEVVIEPKIIEEENVEAPIRSLVELGGSKKRKFEVFPEQINLDEEPHKMDQPKPKRKKLKAKNKNRIEENAQSGQHLPSQAFTAFDYNSVDFRQFEGGAGSAQQQNKQFNSKYHAKGRQKIHNKKFNKTMSFGGAGRKNRPQKNR